MGALWGARSARSQQSGKVFPSAARWTQLPVSERNFSFTRALASGRNCSPAPDLVLSKLIVQPVFLPGGTFFHRHR